MAKACNTPQKKKKLQYRDREEEEKKKNLRYRDRGGK